MEKTGAASAEKEIINDEKLNQQIKLVLSDYPKYIPVDLGKEEFLKKIITQLNMDGKIIQQKIGNINQYVCVLPYTDLKNYIYNNCVDKTPFADNKDQSDIDFWEKKKGK
jgi:hypothetical protein